MEDNRLGPKGSVVKLRVGEKESGEPVFENVLVEPVDEGHLRLLHTPGLALGVASGDIIDFNAEDDSYKVFSRAGNLAVQIFGPPDLAMAIEPEIRGLGGWHDGGVKNLTIFTVPARAGFGPIEAILNSLSVEQGMEWYYGNVYDDDGTTPLGWWEPS